MAHNFPAPKDEDSLQQDFSLVLSCPMGSSQHPLPHLPPDSSAAGICKISNAPAAHCTWRIHLTYPIPCNLLQLLSCVARYIWASRYSFYAKYILYSYYCWQSASSTARGSRSSLQSGSHRKIHPTSPIRPTCAIAQTVCAHLPSQTCTMYSREWQYTCTDLC